MSSSTRACKIRTTGLFKKGNTLHRMCGPKVAVVVEIDRNIYSYVSHTNWTPVNQLLRSMGIRQENLHGPDHFDTVADRKGAPTSFPSGGSSESQVSSSSLLNTPLRQSIDSGRTEDHPIDELVSSLTRKAKGSQLPPLHPATAESNHCITPDVLHGKEQGGRDVFGDIGHKAVIDWQGSKTPDEQQAIRRPQHHGDQGTRKRKRTCSEDDRRRKMVTRSQNSRTHF
ncbi:hypothetical protein BDP55DRAFT_637085 [Colletotrichum godetiae]|uniref:MADS-box domain-containing protein n=1 Tax=Colletotrichum godetiae TaxID=1209918 RepID=A0AAJ0ESA5_9PEZI|nr:uncharacterized protein BDP55DRAFT_637085 [Colletotrichum godetiae]KAK1659344.1 hypothetical protein BDP55DRAFT_637085 [Colletotrichum godetiae]